MILYIDSDKHIISGMKNIYEEGNVTLTKHENARVDRRETNRKQTDITTAENPKRSENNPTAKDHQIPHRIKLYGVSHY